MRHDSLSGYISYRIEMRRLMPNKSLQATRDGRSNSASRFTSFDPACLSSGRQTAYAMKDEGYPQDISPDESELKFVRLLIEGFGVWKDGRMSGEPVSVVARILS